MLPLIALDPRRVTPTDVQLKRKAENWHTFKSYDEVAQLMDLRDTDEFAFVYKLRVTLPYLPSPTELILDARRANLSWAIPNYRVVFRIVSSPDYEWDGDGCTYATFEGDDLHIDSLFYAGHKQTCAGEPSFEGKGAGDIAINLHIALAKACGAKWISLEDASRLEFNDGTYVDLHFLRRCTDGAGYYEKRGFLRECKFFTLNGTEIQQYGYQQGKDATPVVMQLMMLRKMVSCSLFDTGSEENSFFISFPEKVKERWYEYARDERDEHSEVVDNMQKVIDGGTIDVTSKRFLRSQTSTGRTLGETFLAALVAATDLSTAFSMALSQPKTVTTHDLAYVRIREFQRQKGMNLYKDEKCSNYLYAEMIHRIGTAAKETKDFSISAAATIAVEFFKKVAQRNQEAIDEMKERRNEMGEWLWHQWSSPHKRFKIRVIQPCFQERLTNFLGGMQYAAGAVLHLDYVELSVTPECYMNVYPGTDYVSSVMNDKGVDSLPQNPFKLCDYGMEESTKLEEKRWMKNRFNEDEYIPFRNVDPNQFSIWKFQNAIQPDEYYLTGKMYDKDSAVDGRNPFGEWDKIDQKLVIQNAPLGTGQPSEAQLIRGWRGAPNA